MGRTAGVTGRAVKHLDAFFQHQVQHTSLGKNLKASKAAPWQGTNKLGAPLTKDRYGRTVATVTLPNGVQLNEELVRQGMCWWFRKYAPNEQELREQPPRKGQA